jgi:hypothetical protein
MRGSFLSSSCSLRLLFLGLLLDLLSESSELLGLSEPESELEPGAGAGRRNSGPDTFLGGGVAVFTVYLLSLGRPRL